METGGGRGSSWRGARSEPKMIAGGNDTYLLANKTGRRKIVSGSGGCRS